MSLKDRKSTPFRCDSFSVGSGFGAWCTLCVHSQIVGWDVFFPNSPGFSSVLMLRWRLVWLYICARVDRGICVSRSRFCQACWGLYWVCVCVLGVEFFQKLPVVLTQCVFRNTSVNKRVNARGNTRGNTVCETRVGKCIPDIEVGKSAMACDYRCVQLSGLVGWGYLSSQEGSRRRGVSVFVIPCVGVVSFRVS